MTVWEAYLLIFLWLWLTPHRSWPRLLQAQLTAAVVPEPWIGLLQRGLLEGISTIFWNSAQRGWLFCARSRLCSDIRTRLPAEAVKSWLELICNLVWNRPSIWMLWFCMSIRVYICTVSIAVYVSLTLYLYLHVCSHLFVALWVPGSDAGSSDASRHADGGALCPVLPVQASRQGMPNNS